MALLPLVLLLLLRLVASASTARISPATALFILGDSTASCAATTLPLNLTLTSSSGKCLFPSTHRLLPDILAAKMGLPPPPLISTLNGTAAEAAKGVNFAVEDDGGGGRGAGGGMIFRMGAAVGQQVRLATETLQLLRLENAATPRDADTAAASAVFVVSFGTDAYARLLSRGADADASAPKYGRSGFGRLLADRVARAVAELYEAGARRMAVMGVTPVGCTPRVMWEGLHLVDGRSCVDEANELVEGYNARLAARLNILRTQLSGAGIVFCDMYKGMMDIINHPARYGFDEVRKACCGLGPFGGTIGCLTKEMVCPTPERHVWWDLYSPTETVTNLLANWLWSALSNSNTSICRPINLEMLTGHAHYFSKL
uniref:GDSL esterase/lipase n=1 Tax=Leersia perrieri TaxID=77586 RepID=A0A0D9XNM4_9ORYZ